MEFYNNRIKHFTLCSKARSFREAAARIGITQSALSASIKRLEQEFGVSLFERSVEGVELTATGARLLQKLSDHQALLKSELEECLRKPESSPLRIACSTNFGIKYVLPTLQENPLAFPNPQVSLVRSSAVMAFLDSGQADFGFVAVPKAPRGFRWVFLKDDPAVIAGRKGRFDHIRSVKSIAALNAEPWVYLASSTNASPVSYAGQSGFAVHGIFELRTLILGGYAIGVTRIDNYTDAEQKLLVYAPVVPKEERVKIYLIHQPNIASRKRSAMMDLVELMRRKWKDL